MSQKCQILINDNIISHKSQRGVARYFRKVVDGIIDHFEAKTAIYSPEAREYGKAKHIQALQFRGSRRLRIGDITASIVAALLRPSVVFSPYYGNMRTGAAEVFTVHDMIYEIFPHYYPGENRYNQKFVAEKKRCFERAAALIAISTSTAADILTYYPNVDASKITVVYHGIDEFFFEGKAQQRDTLEKRYFLYVGHRTVYKNFLRLLAAFGQSGLAKNFDLRVISPSVGGFSREEIDCLDKYALHNTVKLITNATEVNLRESYANAAAFVYPSEYEGFGLPILEAMASGTLAVTSNTSSLPEVGGEVAFYFDPYNEESIVHSLQHIARLSVDDREHRIRQGIERAKTFSWTRCQQQTVDVLRQFI